MDSRIVLAVVVSTILGATIGFGASYVMFSWPVQSLQDDLSKAKADISGLNSDVDDIQSGVADLQNDFTSTQNSLLATQSSLVSLNSTLNAMDSRGWHEVCSVRGSSDTASSIFELKGKMFQVSWSFTGLSTDAWIRIDVCFLDGSIYWFNGSSGVYGTFDVEGPIVETDLYRLHISSYNANSWSVLVYDYY